MEFSDLKDAINFISRRRPEMKEFLVFLENRYMSLRYTFNGIECNGSLSLCTYTLAVCGARCKYDSKEFYALQEIEHLIVDFAGTLEYEPTPRQ